MQHRSLKLLEDIRASGQNIFDDTADETFESFRQKRHPQQLVERNFEIMGEAMRRLHDLDPETASKLTNWRSVIDLRNIVAHLYDEINHATLWQIIQTSLPILIEEVKTLLADSPEES